MINRCQNPAQNVSRFRWTAQHEDIYRDHFVHAADDSIAAFEDAAVSGAIAQPHVFCPKYTVEPPIQNGYLHATPDCGCAVVTLFSSVFPLEKVNSKQLFGDAAQ